MSVVGAALRGFGKALKRGYRLKRGIRGKTITSVKPAVKIPGASAKDIERSRQAGHTKVWSQRKKIADDLDKKVEEGKKTMGSVTKQAGDLERAKKAAIKKHPQLAEKLKDKLK